MASRSLTTLVIARESADGGQERERQRKRQIIGSPHRSTEANYFDNACQCSPTEMHRTTTKRSTLVRLSWNQFLTVVYVVGCREGVNLVVPRGRRQAKAAGVAGV